MDLELTGRAAIVTGGSVGIGKAVALELAREGVDVAICARGQERLDAAAEEISNETGRRVIGVQADVTDQASVENLAKAAHDAFGRIDILVNNAAFPGGLVRGSLEDADEGPLLEDINTKVMGYFRCAKAAAPYMKQQRWGRIINIGGLVRTTLPRHQRAPKRRSRPYGQVPVGRFGTLWHHRESDSSRSNVDGTQRSHVRGAGPERRGHG